MRNKFLGKMNRKIKEIIESIGLTIIAIPMAFVIWIILIGYMIYDLVRLILSEIKFIWAIRHHIIWNWIHITNYNNRFP